MKANGDSTLRGGPEGPRLHAVGGTPSARERSCLTLSQVRPRGTEGCVRSHGTRAIRLEPVRHSVGRQPSLFNK